MDGCDFTLEAGTLRGHVVVGSNVAPLESVHAGEMMMGDPGAVLIVDDDAELCELIAMCLQRAGLATMEAHTGEECLVVAAAKPDAIDAIVLDVMMPGMNGYQVLARLKEDPLTAEIPIVLLTAHATTEIDVVRGMEGGAVDLLKKPFSGAVLVAKVRSACRHSRSERLVRDQLRLAERNATVDNLTQLYNRRHLETRLLEEAAASRRHAHRYALLFIDIDHFKDVNDTYGHQAGDEALAHFSRVLSQMARGNDAAFRYGGEEFVLLLSGCDEAGAIAAGERLAAALRGSPVQLGGVESVITFSAGVAVANEANGFDGAQVLERADAALYRAKQQGRNRILGEKRWSNGQEARP